MSLDPRKIELRDIYLKHDIDAFREFIRTNMPELVSQGWLDKTAADLSHLMHIAKAHAVYLGDEWQISRNVLRARQFKYTPEQAETLPSCYECQYFRHVKLGEASCMQMGASPNDISCPSFKKIKD